MKKGGVFCAMIRRKGESGILDYAVTLDGVFVASGTVENEDLDVSFGKAQSAICEVLKSIADKIKSGTYQLDLRKDSER